MTRNQSEDRASAYWDQAGAQGYAEAMYRSADVETHVRGRLWQIAVEIADALNILRTGRVLDLGCGDGAFANRVLAECYQQVDGLDKSEAAIGRAKLEAKPNVSFREVDLETFDYESLPQYDAAFLIGILHHIKSAAPKVIHDLGQRTSRMVILEPNGNNLVRKALEFTPTYRRAGEDSFTAKQLKAILERAGWKTVFWRRLNLFPNFTPSLVYRLFAPLEHLMENNRLGRALCTVDLYGVSRADAFQTKSPC